MEALPADVETLLVKGLSAYMRATPSHELPAGVRRLQNFRQKSLVAHKAQLLGMLDDDIRRALILQWLDDERPSLGKKEAQALRAACARADGWQSELASLSEAAPAKEQDGSDRQASAAAEALGRERAKASQARREARNAKEQARQSLEAERARSADLTKELASVRRELEDMREQMADARAEANAAREQEERNLRKARRDLETARAKEQGSRRALGEARKEVRALQRRLGEVQEQLAKARAGPARRRSASRRATGPRKPLAVPKGRLPEDAETLDEWLDTPNVHLLVDGYNVTKAEGGYGELSLEAQRERLLEALEKLALRKQVATRVVFDGSDIAPGLSRRSRGRVQVEYSRAGEIADDHLIARLQDLPPDPVVVVTNDRELQERAGDHGATLAGSSQLLELLGR